jgi:hypothetical protein
LTAIALAALFTGLGDAESATHFRRSANLDADRALLRSQAHHLVTVPADEWNPEEMAHATEVLIHSVELLIRSDPFQDLLRFAQSAENWRLTPKCEYCRYERSPGKVICSAGLVSPTRLDASSTRQAKSWAKQFRPG